MVRPRDRAAAGLHRRRSTTRRSCSARLHRFDEAFAIYRRSAALDPDNAPATDWDLSLLHMMTGNFEAGWPGREARWSAPVLSATYPKFQQPMWLGEGEHRRQDHPDPCRRGTGRYHSVRALCADVAARGARVILVVARRRSIRCCPDYRRLGVPAVSGRTAAGVRPALPVVQPAAGFRNAARHAFRPRYRICRRRPKPACRPGKTASAAHDKLRVGLVWSGNPAPRQRSQPLDPAAHAFAHPRCRRDLRQPAERPEARRPGDAARTHRHHRPHRRPHRFQSRPPR